jgi:hypothetical protein
MFRHKSITLAITTLLIATLACSGPGAATPDVTATFAVALTQAFATAEAANLPNPGVATQVAQDTQSPAASSTPLTLPQATVVKPSDTPAPTNTPGVQGCSDGAEYVADVTIPDNTLLNPGQAFTKTWRLKNSGTCTWVNSYQFAFVADNQMGGPASVAVSGNVAPGSLYDVSVNLIAPNTPGTYKGSWQMKNATGQLFGSTPFVQIVVPAPTSTNTPVTPTATFTATTPVTATFTPTATNTTAPSVTFTSGYAGYWFCGTTPEVSFQIINTGGVAIESLNIYVEGPVGTYLNGNTQNAPFRSTASQAQPACTQLGEESLAPGAAKYVGTNLPAIPPGGTGGKAIIKLCSQNDLGGSCLEVIVNFNF